MFHPLAGELHLQGAIGHRHSSTAEILSLPSM